MQTLHAVRLRIMLLVVLFTWIATFAIAVDPVDAQKLPPDAAASQLFALVNDWRIAEGAPPLVINPQLQKMAEDQAASLLPRFESLTEYRQYHEDTAGRNHFKRAFELYEWPNYSLPERIEVGENVAQFNLAKSLDFWRNSEIHRKTAINPAYREGGMAGLAYPKGGYLFVLVLGARPNIVPVLVNPATNQAFLSRENSRYARDRKAETRIRLYDEQRTPISDETAWQAVIDLPAAAGQRFYIQFKYGKQEVWTLVDRARDIAIITGSPMTVAVQLRARAAGTDGAAPTVVAPTLVAQMPTPLPPQVPTQAPAQPTVVVVAATPLPPPPTATRVVVVRPPNTKADLVVSYSSAGLFVRNVASKPINIAGLTIGRLTTANWLNVAAFPADKFSPGHCLQVNVAGAAEMALPNGCKLVRSAITVSPSRVFWKQGLFAVVVNGKQLAECSPDAEQCEVALQ